MAAVTMFSIFSVVPRRFPCIRRGIARRFSTPTTTPNPLPASFLRGGTSKGIYIHRDLLPPSQDEWTPILLGLMGSPDKYGRQLNGMGGGVSSLSKVCVVGPPQVPEAIEKEADVEYTFVQVGIDKPELDFSGNCGNLTSMVGVFALDEGICRNVRLAAPSSTTEGNEDTTRAGTVRLFNTNTRKLIDTTFPLSSTSPPVPALDLPQTRIAGVDALSSAIALDFLSPAGTRTGSLLPTGNPTDTLTIPSLARPVHASLVDATNPTIFVSLSDLASQLEHENKDIKLDLGAPHVRIIVEELRQAGAIAMGLDPNAQAQPKIAFLSPSPDADADLRIDAFSMGVPHKAVPGTIALCAGVAASVDGTVAWKIARASLVSRADRKDIAQGEGEGQGMETCVRLRHPGGDTEVGAVLSSEGEVQSARLFRTGRRLMKGVVWW